MDYRILFIFLYEALIVIYKKKRECFSLCMIAGVA